MTQTAIAATQARRALIDIALPVYNEETDLERSVRRLHEYLGSSFPFDAVITVVDNASTDATWSIAVDLEAELSGVRALHLDEKGRGRALRAAWSTTVADVVAYMDIDLSTDLDALLPLVAPLVSGHSDLAIGSRLARGAKVIRGPKRELISRCYNGLLSVVLRTRFSDAQCGFKAMRRSTAVILLPVVVDSEWFFDTELLVVAERRGLRIHEVPVDWSDDPDSRVDVVPTAFADLRGVWRLWLHDAIDPIDLMAAHLEVDDVSELVRFLGTSALWPLSGLIVYLVSFALLQGSIGAYVANLVGLAGATLIGFGPILHAARARTARPLRCMFEVSAVRVIGSGLVTAATLALGRLISTSLVAEIVALCFGAALVSLIRFIYLDAVIYRRHIAKRSAKESRNSNAAAIETSLGEAEISFVDVELRDRSRARRALRRPRRKAVA